MTEYFFNLSNVDVPRLIAYLNEFKIGYYTGNQVKVLWVELSDDDALAIQLAFPLRQLSYGELINDYELTHLD